MPPEPADTVVDATGLHCPEPVFRARRALESLKPGQVVEIVADDPLAELDLEVLCRRGGHELSVPASGDGAARYRIRKGVGPG